MDIEKILIANYPGTIWVLEGEEYAGLNWLDESPKPTKAALEKQWPEVDYKVEYDKVTQLRKSAYQQESDPIYMEAQRDSSRTIAEWEAKIEEIKARYPYPAKPSA